MAINGKWSDFIETFLSFTSTSSSPECFRLWSAISTLAGAMERRCWIESNFGKTFPNIYVLLVAPPGIGKNIIELPKALWAKAQRFHVAPDSITNASLIDSLEESAHRGVIDDGKTLLEYNSMLIAAEEFAVLCSSHDLEFLGTLNYIFNNPPHFRQKRRGMHREKKEKEIFIPAPQLNILAGAQPGFLAETLPESAWSMGFTQRLIMIYAGSSRITEIWGGAEAKAELEASLIHQVQHIASLYGAFGWKPDAMTELSHWHRVGGPPVPEHPRLTHYKNRRTQYLMKLCMVASISREPSLTITIDDFERAKSWLLQAEESMPDVFREMAGKSDSAVMKEIHWFMWKTYSKENKPIGRDRVYRFAVERAPSDRVQKILEMMVESGTIVPENGGISFVPKPLDQLGGIP